MSSGKIITGLLVAALLGVAVIYLLQQRQLEQLRAANQDLLARQQQLAADREAAEAAAQATTKAQLRQQQEHLELLRLRNQVEQLRRERDAAKQRASQPAPAPAATAPTATSSGRYITADQLTFAGYATPEAALESMTWAMMKGTYEQSIASLGPEMQKSELNDPKSRDQFEKGRKQFAPLFKGLQVVARKSLGDDRVELKVKMDADSPPDSKVAMPPYMIQPMVKVGNEWKLGGSTRGYTEKWDQDGQIESPGP
jgi:hypothetical protein